MIKNDKKHNALIKKKNLILMLKYAGIKRISPDSVLLLQTSIENFLEELINLLKEELIISGKKTLKKADIEEAIQKIKKEQVAWEV